MVVINLRDPKPPREHMSQEKADATPLHSTLDTNPATNESNSSSTFRDRKKKIDKKIMKRHGEHVSFGLARVYFHRRFANSPEANELANLTRDKLQSLLETNKDHSNHSNCLIDTLIQIKAKGHTIERIYTNKLVVSCEIGLYTSVPDPNESDRTLMESIRKQRRKEAEEIEAMECVMGVTEDVVGKRQECALNYNPLSESEGPSVAGFDDDEVVFCKPNQLPDQLPINIVSDACTTDAKGVNSVHACPNAIIVVWDDVPSASSMAEMPEFRDRVGGVPQDLIPESPGESFPESESSTYSHGTTVASVVGGHLVGICDRAEIKLVSWNDDPSEVLDRIGDLAAQARVMDKVVLVQMSFALFYGSAFTSDLLDELVREETSSNSNLLFVVSAGNEREDHCNVTQFTLPDTDQTVYRFPKLVDNHPSYLYVAASNIGNTAIDEYSNFGPCVNHTAPGIMCALSTLDGDPSTYAYMVVAGTSFSAPLLLSSVASSWSKNTSLSRSKVLEVLNENVTLVRGHETLTYSLPGYLPGSQTPPQNKDYKTFLLGDVVLGEDDSKQGSGLGLSTGAMIGIGVGIGVILLVVLAYFYMKSHKSSNHGGSLKFNHEMKRTGYRSK